MSHEEQRASRRHNRPRPSARHESARPTEELLNHPSFKYTFASQQMRGV